MIFVEFVRFGSAQHSAARRGAAGKKRICYFSRNLGRIVRAALSKSNNMWRIKVLVACGKWFFQLDWKIDVKWRYAFSNELSLFIMLIQRRTAVSHISVPLGRRSAKSPHINTWYTCGWLPRRLMEWERESDGGKLCLLKITKRQLWNQFIYDDDEGNASKMEGKKSVWLFRNLHMWQDPWLSFGFK